MAQTVYTRTLPNLTRATRREAYRRLVMLIDHLESFNIDLLSFNVDVTTRIVTIIVSDPIPTGQIDHINLEGA